jgi:subtilisin family serine protease
MAPNGSLTASNFASGFPSSVYPGRNVPDVCGLVGQLPLAIYIMLPLRAGNTMDVSFGGKTFPNGDETATNDGWGAFSGTSAAAPQLAGVCALIKQACAKLNPASVKDILIKSAIDVTTGNASPYTGNHAAGPGPDLATGAGLVDAQKAVLMAKLRCITITTIIAPTPITTIKPPITPITVGPPVPIVGPPAPIVGPTPIVPIVGPVQPVQPVTPTPIQPVKPIAPIINPAPIGPATEEQPAPQPESKLTAEDVAALEDMIMKNDIDLGS